MNSERTGNQHATMDRRSFLGRGSLAASLLLGGTLPKIHAAAKADSAGSVATTTAGKIRGTMQDKVHAFKGVPFAVAQ